MDPYLKLKYEFKGIRDVINEYSSSGNIGNYTDSLAEALAQDQFEQVKYYLNSICIWYQENIGKIHSNEWVFNFDEHYSNKKLLDEINEELKDYDFSAVEKGDNKLDTDDPIIFLSHRSSDQKYGDALEKLITGLGVKNNQLIYTSHPLHKIPLDENIYNYLRKKMNQKVFVIILWSNAYLDSPACLNEMGAAWVTQSDYTSIYTPDFEFGNPKYHECAVDTRKMGAILKSDAHCRASMVELKNKILEMFDLTIDEQTWTYLLNEFILDIQ